MNMKLVDNKNNNNKKNAKGGDVMNSINIKEIQKIIVKGLNDYQEVAGEDAEGLAMLITADIYREMMKTPKAPKDKDNKKNGNGNGNGNANGNKKEETDKNEAIQ